MAVLNPLVSIRDQLISTGGLYRLITNWGLPRLVAIMIIPALDLQISAHTYPF